MRRERSSPAKKEREERRKKEEEVCLAYMFAFLGKLDRTKPEESKNIPDSANHVVLSETSQRSEKKHTFNFRK